MFSPIENNILNLTYKTAIQTSYRAQCYETIRYGNDALFLTWLGSVPSFSFSFTHPYSDEELENKRYYSAYGRRLKEKFEKIAARNSAHKFYFYSVMLDEKLPFCATGSFCIETDFQGRKLQNLSAVKKFNYAQISVLPQSNGTTYFCASVIDDMDKTTALEFVASLKRQPARELANCALRVCLEHIENTYFSPSFIESLEGKQRDEMLKRFNDAIVSEVGSEKDAGALANPLGVKIPAKVIGRNSNLSRIKLEKRQ